MAVAGGDDVLLMQNDFPTDILPWLALEDRGVSVRQIKPAAWILTPEEVEAALTPRTKIVCLSHVHTFSGHMIDAPGIAEICRRHGVIFVLNIVQSLGNRPWMWRRWEPMPLWLSGTSGYADLMARAFVG